MSNATDPTIATVRTVISAKPSVLSSRWCPARCKSSSGTAKAATVAGTSHVGPIVSDEGSATYSPAIVRVAINACHRGSGSFESFILHPSSFILNPESSIPNPQSIILIGNSGSALSTRPYNPARMANPTLQVGALSAAAGEKRYGINEFPVDGNPYRLPMWLVNGAA